MPHNTQTITYTRSLFNKTSKSEYSKNPSSVRSLQHRRNKRFNLISPVTSAPKEMSSAFATLRTCLKTNNVERFNAFINYGINIHANSSNGWTLLHVAAMYGRAKILRLLLKLNVDPKRLTDNGCNFVDIAQIYGNHRIVKKYKKLAPLSAFGLNLNTKQANPDL